MPAVRLEFDVSYAARKPWVPSARQLAAWATAVLVDAVKVPAGQKRRPSSLVLSVRVVGMAGSRRLNARYRRKDRATNVLSFGGAGAAPDGRYFLGELVICAPGVARAIRVRFDLLRGDDTATTPVIDAFRITGVVSTNSTMSTTSVRL